MKLQQQQFNRQKHEETLEINNILNSIVKFVTQEKDKEIVFSPFSKYFKSLQLELNDDFLI